MITSRAELFTLGCLSTGMPRPLSMTVTTPPCRSWRRSVAMAAERLIDRVVDDLADQVVQPALIGGADVHAGPATNCLQTLQDLDRAGVVGFDLRCHELDAPFVRLTVVLRGSAGTTRRGCRVSARRGAAGQVGHGERQPIIEKAHPNQTEHGPRSRQSRELPGRARSRS